MKWGWELRLLTQFAPIGGCGGCGRRIPRGYFLCAGALLESHLLGIGRPLLTQVRPSSTWEPKVPQMAPRRPKGAKGKPKRRQGEPLGSPRRRKGSQKAAQPHPKESKMSSKDSQRRPANHKTIYTYTEYTQTPDPPPYSCRLVIIIAATSIFLFFRLGGFGRNSLCGVGAAANFD